MAQPMALYPGNDQIITLPDVADERDGTMITGATVTATLYQSDLITVATDLLDHAAMADVEGKAGSYEVELGHAFDAPPGDYWLVYEGTWQSIQFKVRQKVRVAPREVK